MRAAGAADILDHHGLAEHLAHVLGHDARDDIARAAGREGDDDGDRVGGIVFGGRGGTGDKQGADRAKSVLMMLSSRFF